MQKIKNMQKVKNIRKLTEWEKDNLAKECDFTHERYTDKVKEGVKEKFPHPEEELAILRKAVAYLFELISKLHEGEINNAEFAEYNAIVEAIKAQTKAELDLG